jgi:hypothetical protein
MRDGCDVRPERLDTEKEMSSQVDRYLVAPAQAGNPDQQKLLGDVQRILGAAPGASVVRVQGSPPERLVVEMQADTARYLQTQFGHGLIIEPDAPLHY